jgi:putative flippase GtrA
MSDARSSARTQRVREDSMRDTRTSDSQQEPFSPDELDEARWMDATLKTRRVTRPGDDSVTANLRQELGAGQSYYDTRWPLVNQALALTERLTGGRAGVLQRLFTYLLIGGTAAVVNLGVFAIFGHYGSLKVLSLYSVVAYIAAYEFSILANFIPNDYFTFRFLPGHQRSWLARCARFHLTSLSGVLVTFILSWIFYHPLDLPLLVSQGIALILAVFYNFTVHHLFTYASQHKR